MHLKFLYVIIFLNHLNSYKELSKNAEKLQVMKELGVIVVNGFDELGEILK